MAMISQGIQFHMLSSAVTTRTTSVDIQSTCIVGVGANFGAAGFTTAMWVYFSTKSTELHRVKSITGAGTSVINIFGAWTNTGTTTGEVVGHTSTYIGEVTGFSGPSGQAAIINCSHFQSTAHEKMIGIRDEGEVAINLNFSPSDTAQKMLIADRAARSERFYSIVFTDITSASTSYPSWLYFRGHVLGFSLGAAVDDKISANVNLSINGPVILTTMATHA